MLNEVLRLRAKGLSVFPVSKETKQPLVKWDEFQEALPTKERVTEMFEGRDCAVGVATGKLSGIFMLDFDFYKAPEAKAFYDAHTFPRTWSEQTSSGGLHLYFRWTPELDTKKTMTRSKICLGVDTRGEGGFAKITPSEGYKWLVSPFSIPPALPPKWLVDLLESKDAPQQPVVMDDESRILSLLDSIEPGHPTKGRTPVFLTCVGVLKKRGLMASEISKFLAPWAEKNNYGKLDQLIKDQFKRYPVPQQTEEAELPSCETLVEFLQDQKPVPYVVDALIAENTINIIAGLQESRKSWLLLDLALSLASGQNWIGKFPCAKKRVQLIDQERPKIEMQRRIKALCAGRSIPVQHLEGYLLPPLVGTTTKINLDRSFEALCRKLEDRKPDVLLIDSLKAIQSEDITSNQAMQYVMERFKELRLKYGLTIVILHHENKMAYSRSREAREVTAETIAGAAAISEVPEALFVATTFGTDASILNHVKNSYGTKIAPLQFKVTDVEVDRSAIRVEAF